jgi:hypothetical protein
MGGRHVTMGAAGETGSCVSSRGTASCDPADHSSDIPGLTTIQASSCPGGSGVSEHRWVLGGDTAHAESAYHVTPFLCGGAAEADRLFALKSGLGAPKYSVH